MGDSMTISSFVIRFVQDTSDPSAAKTFRGAIRHVQTDRTLSFTKWADAESFIRNYISLETIAPGEACHSRENYSRKD